VLSGGELDRAVGAAHGGWGRGDQDVPEPGMDVSLNRRVAEGAASGGGGPTGLTAGGKTWGIELVACSERKRATAHGGPIEQKRRRSCGYK
jgi:hypothetical protein